MAGKRAVGRKVGRMAVAPVHRRVAVTGPIGFVADKAVEVVAVHMAAEPVLDSTAQGALDLAVVTEDREIEAAVLVVAGEVCCILTVLEGMVKMRHKGLGLSVAQTVTVAARKRQDAVA
jgi:hypothetical protein